MAAFDVCSEDYRGSPYSSPQLNHDIHGWNRFGGTNDLIGTIVKKGPWSDYITGLLILSIFIFSFFASWTLVILIFKCLGQKRVGYLSGSPFDDSTQDNRCCKPKVLRWIAFFSCLFVVAYSIAVAVVNQETFISAIDQLIDTNRYVNNVARQVNSDASSLRDTSDSLSKISNDLKNVTSGGLCPGRTITTSRGENFNDIITTATDKLDTTTDVLVNQVKQLESASQNVIDRTNDAQKHLDDFKKFDWVLMAWSIPMIFFTAIYLLGLILAWVKKSNRPLNIILSYINMPLFTLFITVGWFLCGVFSIVAMANADFCTGGTKQSPAGSVQEIFRNLETNNELASELANDIVKYYTDGCNECPYSFIDDVEKNLDTVQNRTSSFVNSFNETGGVDQISQQCDTRSKEDIQKIQDTFQSAKSQLSTIVADVKSILSSLFEALSCKKIHGLWVNAVENLACKKTVDAFHSGFWSWLFSSIFGLLLVTIRATYLEND